MILLKRRRLVIWLVRAYLKKWGKTILLFFFLGLIAFFLLRVFLSYISTKLPFVQKETIGIVGVYTSDNLPEQIGSKVGRGLTKIGEDGLPKPDLSGGWEIKDNGKTYIFRIKKGLTFSDGSELNSNSIHYNFLNVKEERPDKYTIVFKLKDNYAPFLVTVSKPVFKNNSIGSGEYEIRDIKLNGDFIQSVDLVSAKNSYDIISYQIYPSEQALKNAYVLGEVKEAFGLTSLDYKETTLDKFKNTKVDKVLNKYLLVAIFYNNQDPVLSEKRLRQALTYAIPNKFVGGETNRAPYSDSTWINQEAASTYLQDLEHSKLLLSESESATKSATTKLTITTLAKYENVANEVKKSWQKIGIDASIKTTESLPDKFQIFLGDFRVSKDPDQYTLWHSAQENNITRYKNLRIDKLLEDGRKTADFNERQKIYYDFQKYLLDDSPASFLYLPYTYQVRRK
ncbi:MAG: hypothetical protein A2W22_04225 [Candidatus Levybacteria bacterium RBG_16_35_11]|nr:MAG: hypothetical protein A2W22_04225 [Candidatus Levybacteria bacterium RBG_16_35_11]